MEVVHSLHSGPTTSSFTPLLFLFFVAMCACVCLTTLLHEDCFDFPSNKFILIATVFESWRNEVKLTNIFVILAVAYTLATSENCAHNN